jgi:hypothetical protein
MRVKIPFPDRLLTRVPAIILGPALMVGALLAIGAVNPLERAAAQTREQDALDRRLERNVRTITRTASFHTDGQSLWGRGAGQELASDIPFFDLSWDESGSAGEISSVCMFPDLRGGCATSGDFGARLHGATGGRVGLGAHYKLGAGELTIDYPVQIEMLAPASFTPGKWATIKSALDVLPDARITTATPDGHIDLNGVFGFSANAGAKGCLVSCGESSTSVHIPTSTGRLFRINSTDVHDFTEIALQELGLSGSVQLPDLSVGQTTVNPDGSLSASGSGEYAGLGISAIEWGLKLAGIELPLNYDLPTCCGASAGYTTFDSTFSTAAEASLALRFTPEVTLSLTLPRALEYVVHTHEGSRETGRGKTIVFSAGERVGLRVPADQTTQLRIVPTARIDRPTLLNRTTTDISFGGEVEALEAHASVPPFPLFFPGIDVTLGPVYKQAYPLTNLPTIDVLSDKWPVEGFAAIAMAPFFLEPD